MNKQELIEYCEYLKGDLNKFINGIDVNKIIAKIEQLDEPQKVQVPQSVAEWIEKGKKELSLRDLMSSSYTSTEVGNWLGELDKDDAFKNQETFARAVLDGYTVEKEPKYTVKFKSTKQYLCNDDLGPHFDPSFRTNFTKSDLEKLDLGWVFDCKGMEVEKVGK